MPVKPSDPVADLQNAFNAAVRSAEVLREAIAPFEQVASSLFTKPASERGVSENLRLAQGILKMFDWAEGERQKHTQPPLAGFVRSCDDAEESTPVRENERRTAPFL